MQFYLWRRFKWRPARKKAEEYLSFGDDPTKTSVLVKGLGDGRPVVYVKAYDSALSLFQEVPVQQMWQAEHDSLQVPQVKFGFVGAFAAYSLFRLGKQVASPHLKKTLDEQGPLLNSTWTEYKQSPHYAQLSEYPRCPHPVGMHFAHLRFGEDDPLQQLVRRVCLSLILLKKWEDESGVDCAHSLRENDLGFYLKSTAARCSFQYALSPSMVARWTLGEIPSQTQEPFSI